MAYTTINNSRNYFEPKNWTGDGSASRNITGVGFQPDWVWVKCRNATVNHAVYDSVRGASKLINTNTTTAEGTNAAVNAFISDGFTINSDSYVNTNGNQYASWNWKANGAGSSNTDGSVTATLSANSTSGFSISTFTTPSSGTFTVGHGLGVAPKMIIYRPTGSSSWQVGHNSIGWTNFLTLNSSSASSANTAFGNTAPTTSYWTGNTANVGANAPCVAYCFAEIPGFSKFGSYTGNGNADGTFVYTGFKPAFLITKVTSTTGDWEMVDWKRASSVNPINKDLRPNNSDSETTSNFVDFYSNGFKIRTTGSNWNSNGQKYVYMCFAQAPLVGTNNIPCTAK